MNLKWRERLPSLLSFLLVDVVLTAIFVGCAAIGAYILARTLAEIPLAAISWALASADIPALDTYLWAFNNFAPTLDALSGRALATTTFVTGVLLVFERRARHGVRFYELLLLFMCIAAFCLSGLSYFVPFLFPDYLNFEIRRSAFYCFLAGFPLLVVLILDRRRLRLWHDLLDPKISKHILNEAALNYRYRWDKFATYAQLVYGFLIFLSALSIIPVLLGLLVFLTVEITYFWLVDFVLTLHVLGSFVFETPLDQTISVWSVSLSIFSPLIVYFASVSGYTAYRNRFRIYQLLTPCFFFFAIYWGTSLSVDDSGKPSLLIGTLNSSALYVFIGLFASFWLHLLILMWSSVNGLVREIFRNWLRRIRAPAHNVEQKSDTPPALLLRTFSDDETVVQNRHPLLSWFFGMTDGTVRIEEVVVSSVSALGPIVTLDNPNMATQPLGAARVGPLKQEWKLTVAQKLRKARAVVVLLGKTNSMSWELEQIFANGLEDKLILICPPSYPDKFTLAESSDRLLAVLGVPADEELRELVDVLSFTGSSWNDQKHKVYRTSSRKVAAYSRSIRDVTWRFLTTEDAQA